MTRPGAASSLSAPCPFSLRHYQSDISSHSHDFAQLVIPLDGPLEIEVQGQGRRLAPGFACDIAPGERHDYAADPALSIQQGRPTKADRRQLADWQRWSVSVDDLA